MKTEGIPKKISSKTPGQTDFDFDQSLNLEEDKVLPADKESQPDYTRDHDWSKVKPKKRWIH